MGRKLGYRETGASLLGVTWALVGAEQTVQQEQDGLAQHPQKRFPSPPSTPNRERQAGADLVPSNAVRPDRGTSV